MKQSLFLLVCLFALSSLAQQPVGIFNFNEDIGKIKIAGSASYNEQDQSYTISGSGGNIWFDKDEFHYLYKKISGDFILTADFEFTGDNSKADGHRKIGWMVRESSDPASASINAALHWDEHCLLQWRPYRGMFMRDPEEERFFPKRGQFQTVQLKRIGDTFTMKLAHAGEPLQLVVSEKIEFKSDVLAGLFICSHNADLVAQARIWNVRIDRPVLNPHDANPKAVDPPVRETMGSRLEILDVTNGDRKVIYESKGRFEAPNWMPDGNKLLFNEGGSIYTIPVTGGTPEKLNTGTVARNNNDHLISFDGKMLAISSHRDGLPGGGSTVYTLPLTGGEPKLITEDTPSYLHGWNPNGKEVAITAQRNGEKIYNLYKVSLKDGKETALTTNTKGHVDGPEYSPDGKYIYYNANASGTMQIWRMNPDGTEKKQLTFDEYHNWFPHISPDGNLMVFISFPPDIAPNDHPMFQEVMLRVMELNAPGGPRVVAYLFGGQGTINVNSWSPDSKHLAFVSNSEKN